MPRLRELAPDTNDPEETALRIEPSPEQQTDTTSFNRPIELYSVTTLIKAALGVGEGIVGWAAKVTAERAVYKLPILRAFVENGDEAGALRWLKDARWEHLQDAQDRGKAVHKELEGIALGGALSAMVTGGDLEETISPFREQLERFVAEHKPIFKLSEASVYHPEAGYAGTLDTIVEFPAMPGVDFVMDAKSTAKAPPEVDPEVKSRPPYPEVALQTCLYRHAQFVGLTPAVIQERYRRRYYVFDETMEYAPMPETRGAFALIVSPWDYLLVPVATGDDVWRAARFVIEAARWNLHLAKDVIGVPVAPPQ